MGHTINQVTMKVCFLALSFLGAAHADFSQPSTTETSQMLSQQDFDVIVDVRSRSEYEKGHIENATLIESGKDLHLLEGCEDKKVAVYCWTGHDRSTPAAKKLDNDGYNDVWDLGGLQFMDEDTPTKTGGDDADKLPECSKYKKRPKPFPWALLIIGLLVLPCLCYCCIRPVVSHYRSKKSVVSKADNPQEYEPGQKPASAVSTTKQVQSTEYEPESKPMVGVQAITLPAAVVAEPIDLEQQQPQLQEQPMEEATEQK